MTNDTRIAVIGMALKYPSANNIEEFHRILAEGDFVPVGNQQIRGDLLGISDYKRFINNIRLIDRIDEFDNTFFGIMTSEAREMPPEMRISLQCSAEAIMNAGYSIREIGERNCGAVISHESSNYRKLLDKSNVLTFFNNKPGMTGGYLSHYLKLTGPLYTIDSTCSSSITAVATACGHLIMGQADLMIAGGVQICLPLNEQEGKDMMISTLGLSSDQRCIPFDVNAAGFYNSEGAGFVLLERYEDAIKNGDNILGVITGYGMYSNSDKSQTVYAPYAEAQIKAREIAWKMAGVNCNDITECEPHGSATKQGDASEAKNFISAFSERSNHQKVYLSAVKSNFGHTACAAGITGLLKVLSGFAHNMVYPISGFTKAVPELELDKANVMPVSEAITMPVDKKRIVDLSSYGLNELNIDVVIENYIDKNENLSHATSHDRFLKCSAKSETQVRVYLEHIAEDLNKCDDDKFWDMIYTLNFGRDDYKFRCFITFENKEELLDVLKQDINIVKCKPTNEVSDATDREKLKEDYLNGKNIDWKTWYSSRRYNRIPTTVYPFSNKSIWPAVKQK